MMVVGGLLTVGIEHASSAPLSAAPLRDVPLRVVPHRAEETIEGRVVLACGRGDVRLGDAARGERGRAIVRTLGWSYIVK